MPPPLQDISHRFLSSLPPSSSPALSYIDEGVPDQLDRIEPSSAFLGLSASSDVHHILPIATVDSASDKENKENLSPFDIENEFEPLLRSAGPSNVIFSTPKPRKGGDERSPPFSDPFGFLAVERKLKLQRAKAKHKHDDSHHQPAEPERIRWKLDPGATPAPSQIHVAWRSLARRTPTRITLGHDNKGTQTPLSLIRRTADTKTLSPPAVTSLHQKRRRSTLVFDEGNNPFLDSHADTPSPSKRHQGLCSSYNDGALSSPTLSRRRLSTTTKTGVPAAVASPIRLRRKRVRLPDSEADKAVGNPNETLSALADDPDALAGALRSRLPKRRGTREGNVGLVVQVRKKKTEAVEAKSGRGKAAREAAVKDGDEDEDEDDKENKGRNRRSARLAKRGPPAFDKTIGRVKKTIRKDKGKENAIKKADKKNSKGKGKSDEVPDEVSETWERERVARLAYFKKLDSYELETENIYVL